MFSKCTRLILSHHQSINQLINISINQSILHLQYFNSTEFQVYIYSIAGPRNAADTTQTGTI